MIPKKDKFRSGHMSFASGPCLMLGHVAKLDLLAVIQKSV